jgi:FMN phosphatase YigB (HAD superfamily)
MIEAVLVDWGHTLFDTVGSVDFIVEWSGRHGTPIEPDRARRLWTSARQQSRTAAEIAKGRDTTAAQHHACWTALWSDLDAAAPGVAAALYEFETSSAGWTPYVDTAEVLRALRQRGIPVVVVSDVAFDLRPIMANAGVGEHIHAYALSGEHGTIKPELQLFTIALELAGARAERALMVGDNHHNDGAAIEVGIRTLLLPPVGHGEPRGLWAIIDLVDAG